MNFTPLDPLSWEAQFGGRTIWQEARNQPQIGQIAVAFVLKNRLASGRWGHSIPAVCVYPFQFSGWNTKDPNRGAACTLLSTDKLLLEMISYLNVALQGLTDDPTDGCLFYKRADLAWPHDWGEFQEPHVVISAHGFYKDLIPLKSKPTV